jgi:hypothetical protein
MQLCTMQQQQISSVQTLPTLRGWTNLTCVFMFANSSNSCFPYRCLRHCPRRGCLAPDQRAATSAYHSHHSSWTLVFWKATASPHSASCPLQLVSVASEQTLGLCIAPRLVMCSTSWFPLSHSWQMVGHYIKSGFSPFWIELAQNKVQLQLSFTWFWTFRFWSSERPLAPSSRWLSLVNGVYFHIFWSWASFHNRSNMNNTLRNYI